MVFRLRKGNGSDATRTSFALAIYFYAVETKKIVATYVFGQARSLRQAACMHGLPQLSPTALVLHSPPFRSLDFQVRPPYVQATLSRHISGGCRAL